MSTDNLMMKKRIEELEERIEHLRVSRRVLMNLVEKLEKERSNVLTKLEKENRKLQRSNALYAQNILSKNRRIMELEANMEPSEPSKDSFPSSI
ncbi:translation initiation factor 2 [Dehalobacterium formicoaceticum]|uniref:Translation initiation factor 2 n=1 Tax=Dehalobacterium formicoaceticum TaxID=51515 RepID=A0ABT1Y4W9_9FIRM|nr:translation initiation factor 2 [Dehalobacterium formicoaceticum]MCR6545929.1 translation initiation factor 2 [Dehalobacterium formicoaceticum]